MTNLTLDEFEEENYDELRCIFAESGADRENGFELEDRIVDLWYWKDRYTVEFPQLVYIKDNNDTSN